MTKQDLFIGSFGRGLVFADKSTIEHADYKNIAFIDEYGKIDYYTRPEKLPEEIKAVIENESKELKAEFLKDVEKRKGFDRFKFLADRVPDLFYLDNCKLPLWEQIEIYKAYLIGETAS